MELRGHGRDREPDPTLQQGDHIVFDRRRLYAVFKENVRGGIPQDGSKMDRAFNRQRTRFGLCSEGVRQIGVGSAFEIQHDIVDHDARKRVELLL